MLVSPYNTENLKKKKTTIIKIDKVGIYMSVTCSFLAIIFELYNYNIIYLYIYYYILHTHTHTYTHTHTTGQNNNLVFKEFSSFCSPS